MRILDDMEACYGCGACYNACPAKAISMKANIEGFLEPAVDEKKCISCGKCRKVCPSLNCKYDNKSEPDVFAFSAEEKILYDSSSGGIFTFLAEYILLAGGYVIGASYDSNFFVNHVIIHNIEELDKIRRSKYLQSSTGDTFRKAKALLEKGEFVLYSGCPCQIAGLLCFLGKDYDKLYTVDLVCHGVPSPELFQEHLKNSYGGIENIADVEFRSREGWSSLFKVKFKSGDAKTSYSNKSVYMQSYLQNINLRASCFRCQYSKLPRQGDMTIGDLWTAGNFKLSFEYRKGASVVLINNQRGMMLFQEALSKSKHEYQSQKICGADMEEKGNTKLLNANIFYPSTYYNGNTTNRQKFFDDCSGMKFEKAVYASLHKFDVGLMLYMSNNYGSIATNYALYRIINDTGRRTAILDHLVFMGNEALKFAKKYMKLSSDFMEKDDWQNANQCFETFVVGSDMSWNWNLNQWRRLLRYMMLGFADKDKRMISYAPSFGAKKGEKDIDKDSRALYAYYLNRFDAISVREDYGVDMCRDLFGIKAEQVLDPVLVCDRKIWSELSSMSQLKFDEEYLLAYILNPMPYKRQALLEAAKNLSKKLIVILDLGTDFEANKKAMNMDEKIVRPEFIDWLSYFQHASYVFTDSFHGACFSILYGKKFVAIKNRAKERFDSLANLIECPFLFFEDSMPLLGKTNIFADIDYDSVYKRIEVKRMESEKWLLSALNMKIKSKSNNDSTELMLQLFKSIYERTDALNKIRRDYAYEEEQRKEINIQLKRGKTWLDTILLRNNIVSQDSRLSSVNVLYEYFSVLKSITNYVLVLSCGDECSRYWKKFVEISGLELRRDVGWRESYVAIVDEGVVKAEQKSKEEIKINYEFIVGHPKYSVEYMTGQLKVECMPLRLCKIKIKSKGYTGLMGAYKSEIIADNIDYSMNKTGINIVVINKENGDIIDSINVNTYSDSALKINRI